MTVELPPQTGRIVQEAVLSGYYRSAEDVVTEAVAPWEAHQRSGAKSAESERSEAIERLKNFGKAHGLSFGGITIRELRHEARP